MELGNLRLNLSALTPKNDEVKNEKSCRNSQAEEEGENGRTDRGELASHIRKQAIGNRPPTIKRSQGGNGRGQTRQEPV